MFLDLMVSLHVSLQPLFILMSEEEPKKETDQQNKFYDDEVDQYKFYFSILWY